MSMKTRMLGLIGGMAIAANSFALNDSAIKVKWGYKGAEGPSHWGTLDPSFRLCATGKRQSPIDITAKKSTPTSSFTVDYPAVRVTEIDNGTTEVQIGNENYIIADGHSVQLNIPKDRQDKETLTWNGKKYRLLQFHFHTPSENQWQHEATSAEIHFVHQGPNGELAVMGVFVKVGAANPVLQTIVDYLPDEEGKEVAIEQPMAIAKLLPAKKGAYQFDGSLTTPPCAEGVIWLMMTDSITASPEQIVKLRKAANGANARPVQPLNKRSITFVTEKVK